MTLPDITVITPSLPSRAGMLAEACASVAAQIQQRPVAHLIGVDHAGRGPAAIRNELIAAATTDWVAFLDDDDVLDSVHLAVLAGQIENADVIASHCRFSGERIPPKYCNRPFDRAALREHGIFPITVLARRSAVLAAGGFGDERYEDWELWNRMADQGSRFLVVPMATWTYRLGHGNRTHGNAA